MLLYNYWSLMLQYLKKKYNKNVIKLSNMLMFAQCKGIKKKILLEFLKQCMIKMGGCHEGILLHEGHFCTRGHFCMMTLLHEGHFCMRVHCCKASLLHGRSLLHGWSLLHKGTFLYVKTFAQRHLLHDVTFVWQYFCKASLLHGVI